jgi:TonB family protein
MTARMVLANIVSFGLQVTVVVAAGAALARAFRIDEPRAMLAYWRTLLLACLLLPICQPWNIVIPSTLATTTTVVTSGSAAVPPGPVSTIAPRAVAWPITDFVLIALAVGIALRALWLTLGAYGLRRLRRDALPLEPLPESVRLAQERIGTQAAMYVSDRVSGPITFGMRRPVVVFPPSVSTMPADVQEAIACHELLHVRRRDWIYEILEEAVRSVLWFHPAIWWLIGRIRLTREQVVDQAVITLTNSRERYVEALLSVALASSPVAFAPASPFLRRHLLKKRVARILQETTMTTRRLIASLTVSAAALAMVGVFAVRSFPLEAQGQAPANTGEPIQLVRGGEHLLHGGVPEYPHRAIEQKIEGDVVVEMTLDDRGEVSDARVVSGPEELRKSTLEAVLQWHYAPKALSSTVTQATLRYSLPAEGIKVAMALTVSDEELPLFKDRLVVKGAIEAHEVELKHLESRKLVGKLVELKADNYKVPYDAEREVKPEPHSGKLHSSLRAVFIDAEEDLAQKFAGSPRLADVRTERVTEAAAKELLAQAGVAVGDSVTLEMAKRILETVQAIDEHLHVRFETDDKGALIVLIAAR